MIRSRPFLIKGTLEVNEETQSRPSELQVRQDLRPKYPVHFLNCFDFDKQLSLDHDIDAQTSFESYPVIQYGNRNLGFNRQPALSQLVREAYLINGFEQAR